MTHQVAQLALKYASKLGKMHLADKVSEVITCKMEENNQGLSSELEDYSLRYRMLGNMEEKYIMYL